MQPRRGVRVSPWHIYAADDSAPADPANSSLHPSSPSKRPRPGSPGIRHKPHILVLIAASAAVLIAFVTLGTPSWSAVGSTWPQVQQFRHLPQPPLPSHRVLLSTHNQLAWYVPETEQLLTLHKGEGVHYGVIPGEPYNGNPTLWVVLRPHNWRPKTSKEFLLRLDSNTGAMIERVQVPARFSHDMVRSGNCVYVCSTGDGSILELSYPDMKLVRRHQLFSLKDHPNTLAPLAPGQLWVVLHNLGESDVVALDMTHNPPQEMVRIQAVGNKTHGLVQWGNKLVMLDSEAGALVQLDPYTADVDELWVAPEGGKFLKGLAVVDDIAYFGLNVWSQRSERDDPETSEELAAFDLIQQQLLWRRRVPTAGLLNIVSAPHLGEESTYKEVYSLVPMEQLQLPDSDQVVEGHLRYLHTTGFPTMVGSYWSSGHPMLPVEPKVTPTPWTSGLALPLAVLNVSKAQAFVRSLPASMWTKPEQAASNVVMTGRADNMEKFKPGVQGIVLVFSDQGGQRVFRFPWYDKFAHVLEPLLEEILGPIDMDNIIRLQLARMLPGESDIRIHVDSGGYARHNHRIHVPLLTNQDVHFVVCPTYKPTQAAAAEQGPSKGASAGNESLTSPLEQSLGVRASKAAAASTMGCFRIPSSEGLVFELNNVLPHRVSNEGSTERIHLVIDVAEGPRQQTLLPPGSTCHYASPAAGGLQCTPPQDHQPAAQPGIGHPPLVQTSADLFSARELRAAPGAQGAHLQPAVLNAAQVLSQAELGSGVGRLTEQQLSYLEPVDTGAPLPLEEPAAGRVNKEAAAAVLPYEGPFDSTQVAEQQSVSHNPLRKLHQAQLTEQAATDPASQVPQGGQQGVREPDQALEELLEVSEQMESTPDHASTAFTAVPAQQEAAGDYSGDCSDYGDPESDTLEVEMAQSMHVGTEDQTGVQPKWFNEGQLVLQQDEEEEGSAGDPAWQPHTPEQNLPAHLLEIRQSLGWQLASTLQRSLTAAAGEAAGDSGVDSDGSAVF